MVVEATQRALTVLSTVDSFRANSPLSTRLSIHCAETLPPVSTLNLCLTFASTRKDTLPMTSFSGWAFAWSLGSRTTS